MLSAAEVEAALPWALLAVPVVLALAWGTCFDDRAYATFRHARNLAAGRGLAASPTAAGPAHLQSPLYTLALALPAALGIPLPQASLLLSALGWGAAALAVYRAGRATRRPVAAAVAAALVACSPAALASLGTETPWTLACAWLAIAASLQRRWPLQTGALVLMLGTHLDLGTLALAGLAWAVQWSEQGRFPWRSGLALALATLAWALMARGQIVAPLSPPHLDLARWDPRDLRRLLGESEFYWLFLPWVGVGLLTTRGKAAWAGCLWGAAAALSGGPAAGATLATLGAWLAGGGIDRAVRWVGARGVLRLEGLPLALSLALVAGLPLGVAQTSSLVQRYRFRPVARQALEQRAGEWLRAHSEPTATVLGTERVGYLADRATLAWDGGESDPAALAPLLATLTEHPPDYCVSFKSIAWEHLMRSGWFQEGYAPLQQFGSPYEATSPLTIWGYRLGAFDLGERRPLNVRLPGAVGLIGYRYWPDRIQPGEAVHVTLFLQATRPVTQAFRTVVRVTSPPDGVGRAQRDMVTPRSVPVNWWQTGQVIAERFLLTTTADIPVGAHHLDMSIATPDSKGFLPIYQDDDTAPLDRVILGYVVVPWQGSLDAAQPVDASLGNQISLRGFAAADRLSPGEELEVTLYWEARQPPEEDYVVFVHLLDASNQLVAGHDGPPMEGRYATSAWLPGEVVPDVHRLTLGGDVPAGTYRLQAGMYRWPSLERLPVRDAQGVEQPDRVVVLQSVAVE